MEAIKASIDDLITRVNRLAATEQARDKVRASQIKDVKADLALVKGYIFKSSKLNVLWPIVDSQKY